jgi:hypothetical protein
MPITETWLKANSGKPREKVEEKSDRDSLSARVSAKGKITFQIRFRFDGKGARIDLGSYPLISLKEAREKALEVRSLIEKGIDPRIERKLEKINQDSESVTFKNIFDEWHEKYLFKNKKSANDIYRSFELYVFKEFGVGAQILSLLGIKRINLLTHSKNKEFIGISGFGLSIESRTEV